MDEYILVLIVIIVLILMFPRCSPIIGLAGIFFAIILMGMTNKSQMSNSIKSESMTNNKRSKDIRTNCGNLCKDHEPDAEPEDVYSKDIYSEDLINESKDLINKSKDFINNSEKKGNPFNIDNRAYDSEPDYMWNRDEKYTSCYPAIGYEINNCNLYEKPDIDESLSRLAPLRQRDKKAIDGYVTKNANYYKKHYGRELDEEENKRWWGNDEY